LKKSTARWLIVLKKCLCYSVQIDGSADRQQIDSKFVRATFAPSNEVSVRTVSIGIASIDFGKAEGLLGSFTSCLNVLVQREKSSLK